MHQSYLLLLLNLSSSYFSIFFSSHNHFCPSVLVTWLRVHTSCGGSWGLWRVGGLRVFVRWDLGKFHFWCSHTHSRCQWLFAFFVLCCLDSSMQACRSVAGFSVWGRVLGSTVSSTTRLAEERRSHTPQRCHLPLVQTTTALQHWGVRLSFLSHSLYHSLSDIYSLFHVRNNI